jgi:hypothetical protein
LNARIAIATGVAVLFGAGCEHLAEASRREAAANPDPPDKIAAFNRYNGCKMQGGTKQGCYQDCTMSGFTPAACGRAYRNDHSW